MDNKTLPTLYAAHLTVKLLMQGSTMCKIQGKMPNIPEVAIYTKLVNNFPQLKPACLEQK